jgi:PsbN protein
METSTLIVIPICCLLMSFTGYALYTTFGQPYRELMDPFEEHEN